MDKDLEFCFQQFIQDQRAALKSERAAYEEYLKVIEQLEELAKARDQVLKAAPSIFGALYDTAREGCQKIARELIGIAPSLERILCSEHIDHISTRLLISETLNPSVLNNELYESIEKYRSRGHDCLEDWHYKKLQTTIASISKQISDNEVIRKERENYFSRRGKQWDQALNTPGMKNALIRSAFKNINSDIINAQEDRLVEMRNRHENDLHNGYFMDNLFNRITNRVNYVVKENYEKVKQEWQEKLKDFVKEGHFKSEDFKQEYQKNQEEFYVRECQLNDLEYKLYLNLRNELLRPEWNRTYGNEPGNTYWDGSQDRGGRPYYCPVGWKRYAIKVTET